MGTLRDDMTIRKIIVGKEMTENAMSYAVGQFAVRKKYVIDSIIQREDKSKDIFIKLREGDSSEVLLWKSIHPDIPCVIEYSQYFGDSDAINI